MLPPVETSLTERACVAFVKFWLVVLSLYIGMVMKPEQAYLAGLGFFAYAVLRLYFPPLGRRDPAD